MPARILAIDYGRKKCGIAVSDPLRIIATGLATVPTAELYAWLDDYLKREDVSDLVVGEPLNEDGSPNPILSEIVGFERKMSKRYPTLRLHRQDEYASSKRAREEMLRMGMKKKQRRDKTQVDRIAAALILQDFMENLT